MNLIKCPMCEKDVSPNAKKCPHCGEPLKKKKKFNLKKEFKMDNFRCSNNSYFINNYRTKNKIQKLA